jgi:hypothetical protein
MDAKRLPFGLPGFPNELKDNRLVQLETQTGQTAAVWCTWKFKQARRQPFGAVGNSNGLDGNRWVHLEIQTG